MPGSVSSVRTSDTRITASKVRPAPLPSSSSRKGSTTSLASVSSVRSHAGGASAGRGRLSSDFWIDSSMYREGSRRRMVQSPTEGIPDVSATVHHPTNPSWPNGLDNQCANGATSEQVPVESDPTAPVADECVNEAKSQEAECDDVVIQEEEEEEEESPVQEEKPMSPEETIRAVVKQMEELKPPPPVLNARPISRGGGFIPPGGKSTFQFG